MATGNFYKLILRGQFGSVNTRNEFWYRQTGGDDGAANLATFWQAFTLPAILDITSSDAGYVGVDVYNHNSTSDFVEDSFALVPGDSGAGSLPPFNAVGFSTPRKRTGMRAGQKRFIGVPASNVANGVIVNGGYITLLGTLANALSAEVIDAGDGNQWEPIIVKRVNFGTALDPDYRVPPTIASDGYYAADAWTPKLNVTSQNSRKFGVGI